MEGAVAYAVLVSTLTVLASCHQVCFIGSEYDPRSGKSPRWFLPSKYPCKCTAIRLGGMNIPASSYLKEAPYYLDGLFLSEDLEEIQASFNCQVKCPDPQPLGLEDDTIPDERMTASSAYTNYPASAGRLNQGSCWMPSSNIDSWIQVDMGKPTVVSGIITQGNPWGDTYMYMYRVTKYKVAFKKARSSTLEHVANCSGNIKVFDGNVDDATTPVTNKFHQSIIAVAVRVEPVEWKDSVIMRLELLRCYITREE